ncbi:hypothetical protein D3C84_1254030 [compost metagenome]
MYVCAGTEINYFPLNDCLSFNCEMLKDIKNFFGHVLDPKTPFHNFRMAEREDGKFCLKYFQSGFQ